MPPQIDGADTSLATLCAFCAGVSVGVFVEIVDAGAGICTRVIETILWTNNALVL